MSIQHQVSLWWDDNVEILPRHKQLSKDNPSQNLSQFQVCSYASLEFPSPFCLAIIITPLPLSFGDLFCSAPASGRRCQGPALTCNKDSLLLLQIESFGSNLGIQTLGINTWQDSLQRPGNTKHSEISSVQCSIL